MSWMSISTAPRNGETVLLFDPANGLFSSPYIQFGRHERGGWVMVDEQCGGYCDANPTLWMPVETPKP